MRVWDVPVTQLCNKHLVAQHAEIHAIYSIIVHNKKGYANHPEVKRWRSYLGGLVYKHHITAGEMLHRGMKHYSPMLIIGNNWPIPEPIQPIETQRELLKAKGCECRIQ